MVPKVGRDGEREKAAVRGWLCSPGTTATSKRAEELLAEVNIWAQLNLAQLNCAHFDELNITARTIGGVLANDQSGRVKKLKLQGKSSLWTINRVQDPPGRKSYDKRTAAKLEARSTELKKLEKMEVATASDRSSPAKKSVQVHETTIGHALHFREALLLTQSSQRKFPQAVFLIARSVLKELKLDGLVSDERILQVIPTDYKTLLEKCQRTDEMLLKMDLEERVDAVFSVNDAGNTGKRKVTYRLLVGYDHKDDCVKQVTAGADEVAAGGEHIADAVTDDLELLGNPEVVGSCTDSALDVISKFVEFMTSKHPGFLAVGCLLHIMNLVLMNAYLATFGDEEMGVNSALRIGFMCHYLQSLFPDHWRDFCAAHPEYNDIDYICTGASKGRWWSVIRSFGDVFTNRVAYSEWALEIANHKKGSAYEECAADLSAWLQNQKALADLAFVRGFCLWFWNDEMAFLQGIGPWQLGQHELFPTLSVAKEKQLAGFRADEHGIRVVLMRAKCERLAAAVETDQSFQDFRVSSSLTFPKNWLFEFFYWQTCLKFTLLSNYSCPDGSPQHDDCLRVRRTCAPSSTTRRRGRWRRRSLCFAIQPLIPWRSTITAGSLRM